MSMPVPPRASPQTTKYPVPVQAIAGSSEAPWAFVKRIAGWTGQAVGGASGSDGVPPPDPPPPSGPPPPTPPALLGSMGMSALPPQVASPSAGAAARAAKTSQGEALRPKRVIEV